MSSIHVASASERSVGGAIGGASFAVLPGNPERGIAFYKFMRTWELDYQLLIHKLIGRFKNIIRVPQMLKVDHVAARYTANMDGKHAVLFICIDPWGQSASPVVGQDFARSWISGVAALAVIDVLVGNWDRFPRILTPAYNPGNIYFDKNGLITAIDLVPPYVQIAFACIQTLRDFRDDDLRAAAATAILSKLAPLPPELGDAQADLERALRNHAGVVSKWFADHF